MKKLLTLALVIIIFAPVFSQSLNDQEFTVINYQINILDAFVKQTEEGMKTKVKGAKESLKSIKMSTSPHYNYYTDYAGKQTAYNDDGANKITASLIDTLVIITQSQFKEKLNNSIKPLNILDKKIHPYSVAYPDLPQAFMVRVKKKNPELAPYIELSVAIEQAGSSVGVGGTTVGSGRPLLRLSISITNTEKILFETTQTVESDEKICGNVGGGEDLRMEDTDFEYYRRLFASMYAEALEKVVAEMAAK